MRITDVSHFVSAQAFFVKDYIMNHPEDGDKIGRLRELMFEQVCNKRYEGLDLGRTSETVCDKTLMCQKAELELFGC